MGLGAGIGFPRGTAGGRLTAGVAVRLPQGSQVGRGFTRPLQRGVGVGKTDS